MSPNGLERLIPVLRRAEDMAWCTMEQTFYSLEVKILDIRIDIPNCAVLR